MPTMLSQPITVFLSQVGKAHEQTQPPLYLPKPLQVPNEGEEDR